MKNIRTLIFLLVSLQMNLLQAVMIDGIDYYRDDLEQGFNVLRSVNSSIPKFEEFVKDLVKKESNQFENLWNNNREEYWAYRKKLIEGDDPTMQAMNADDINCDNRDPEPFLTYQTVLKKAENYIAAGVKYQFLQDIKDAIDKNVQDIYDIQSPVFRYVMQIDQELNYQKKLREQNQNYLQSGTEKIYNIQDPDIKCGRGVDFILFQAKQQKWFDAYDVRNEFGRTPLLLASMKNLKEIVQMLLDKNAGVDVQDYGGRTPLHWTVFKNSKEVTQILLDKDAGVDIQDVCGRTPLRYAAEYNLKEIVQVLLDKNAGVDVQDYSSRTPLHWAAYNNSKEIVQMLLDKNANVDIKDDFGRTPLHYAAHYNLKEIVQMLLDKDADMTILDCKGKTAELYAEIRNFSRYGNVVKVKVDEMRAIFKQQRLKDYNAAHNPDGSIIELD